MHFLTDNRLAWRKFQKRMYYYKLKIRRLTLSPSAINLIFHNFIGKKQYLQIKTKTFFCTNPIKHED